MSCLIAWPVSILPVIAAEPQVREAEAKRGEAIDRVAPTVVAVFARRVGRDDQLTVTCEPLSIDPSDKATIGLSFRATYPRFPG